MVNIKLLRKLLKQRVWPLCAGLTPVRLFLDERHVRAWPGGVGDQKMGANYAPTILPQALAARDQGAAQARSLPPARCFFWS